MDFSLIGVVKPQVTPARSTTTHNSRRRDNTTQGPPTTSPRTDEEWEKYKEVHKKEDANWLSGGLMRRHGPPCAPGVMLSLQNHHQHSLYKETSEPRIPRDRWCVEVGHLPQAEVGHLPHTGHDTFVAHQRPQERRAQELGTRWENEALRERRSTHPATAIVHHGGHNKDLGLPMQWQAEHRHWHLAPPPLSPRGLRALCAKAQLGERWQRPGCKTATTK